MRTIFRPAVVLFVLFSAVLGLLYPALVTGIGQLVFPWQANGSLMVVRGRVQGSLLIGQPFTDCRYFWSRPSATAVAPYNGEGSGGSNLGPANPALRGTVAARVAALRAADPGNSARIPIDLVTTSGSGLDPHISPAAAHYQVGRVARARGLSVAEVRRLVEHATEGRTSGFLGEPRVNVLRLNLALDELVRRSAGR